jgi:recombination protein RecA
VNEQRIQGRDGVKTYLKENPDAADELEQKIYELSDKLVLESKTSASSDEDSAEPASARAAGAAVNISADDFGDE